MCRLYWLPKIGIHGRNGVSFLNLRIVAIKHECHEALKVPTT